MIPTPTRPMPAHATRSLLRRLPLAALALLALAGCSLLPTPQADPTRYYVLTGALPDAPALKAEGGLVLGLRHIDIAPYLNGKDMVVRDAGNEITYNRFSRWAEPLATSIGRALAGRLAAAPRVDRVYAQPFPFDVERDYDVTIRVLRCEGEKKPGGKTVASLAALVEVTESAPGGAVVLRKTYVAPETAWNGKDYGALASALSDAVAALSNEVVGALPAQ